MPWGALAAQDTIIGLSILIVTAWRALSQDSKCAPGAPDSMDLSQSQDAPRAAPAAEDGAGLPRKLARARMPSPPCARNIFMDGPEDEPNEATQLTRRPPYVSRYRCLTPNFKFLFKVCRPRERPALAP